MNKVINKNDVYELIEKKDWEQAFCLLLLAGPDGYDGSYAEYNALCDLCEVNSHV